MNFLPPILLLSALLPYLAGGVRLEHLLVPLVAFWSIMRSSNVHVQTFWIVGGLVLAAAATVLFSLESYETGLYAEPVSQLVRLVLPALIMVGFPFALSGDRDASVLVANYTMVLGAATAAFGALSMVWGPAQDVMPLWVRSEEGGVWLSAQDVGRYTGIFNQPVEAGIFYSVALIAGIHAWRFGSWNKLLILLAIAAIIYGGTLSLSKNFIVLGAACALAYGFVIQIIPRAVAVALSLPIIIAIPLGIEELNANYFQSLLDLYYDQGLIAALSAGRFGEGAGTVSILFSSLFSSGDWITGRGLGSFLPLDNGFLEYFYQGGAFALLGYAIALLAFTLVGWRHRKTRDGMLMLVLAAYIWVASMGGPVLTANRANISLLLLVSACLVGIRAARTAAGGERDPQHLRPTPYVPSEA
jgi:hypothetical protein